VLKLDTASHTVTVADQYSHGANFDSEYMGDLQPLANGNEFVGWGSAGYLTEYSDSGQQLLDASMPYPDITYRSEIDPWVGEPTYPPAGAARRTGGRTTVYASWNGGTQVASWRILGGSSGSSLSTIANTARAGFETAIPISGADTTFQVQALDASGKVIGTSRSFAVTG
jgi:hypothetical protein